MFLFVHVLVLIKSDTYIYLEANDMGKEAEAATERQNSGKMLSTRASFAHQHNGGKLPHTRAVYSGTVCLRGCCKRDYFHHHHHHRHHHHYKIKFTDESENQIDLGAVHAINRAFAPAFHPPTEKFVPP